MVMWVAGTTAAAATALTHGMWNADVRDHDNFFKDLLTDGTNSADSGLRIRRGTAGGAAYDARVTGDTQPRLRITAGGKVEFGPGGSGALEVALERVSANRVGVTNGIFAVRRETGTSPAFAVSNDGDANDRFWIDADGVHRWGPSNSAADVALYRPAAAVLGLGGGQDFRLAAERQLQFGPAGGAETWIRQTPARGRLETRQLRVLDGFINKTKNGTINNNDFPDDAAAISGTQALDTNNNRLYLKYGSTWGYIARTAGFEIPEFERDCPRCGVTMQIGERVIGRINELREDGARHGLWEHLVCDEDAA